MQPKPAIHCLFLALVVAVLIPSALVAASAEEREGGPRAKSDSTVLPQGHLFTLLLEEDGESLEFSTAVASRHFSLSSVERPLSFRGRLWRQQDGRELLEFSLEYKRLVQAGDQKEWRAANWSGSAYVENGRRIEIVAGPSYSFAVEFQAP